jgi:hypothetical protein
MEKQLGPEAKLKLEIIDGDLHISVVYAGKGAGANAGVVVDSDYFIDALGELIPGDTMVESITLATLKTTLKALKV